MSAADDAQALFDSGFEDRNEKRFEEGLVKFRAAAAMGHGRAMNVIGVAYNNGEGVAENVVEAYKWFKASAETGEPRALRNLAIGFRKGVPEAGINVDDVEAMRLMRMAADAGLPDAMYDLADWLREANENDPAALEWFMKGADAGNVDCMRMVGELHRIGACGLQPNYSKALPWFERAAAEGDADQILRIANTLQHSGDLVRAVELYEKAAGRGSATAMFNVGVCYERGDGVIKSAEKAVELYQRASDLGNVSAMINLGLCYEYGDGVARSAEKAVELYQRASDLGNTNAMVSLGLCYENGDGVARSAEKAAELFLRASDQGNAAATANLGVCYMNGNGVATNFEKAVALSSRASDQGNATAMVNLGLCYMNGMGVVASMRVGAEFWLRAAAMGESNVKQAIDSGMLEWPDETCYCVVTGLLSGGAPDGAAARKLLETRQTNGRFSRDDCVFDGDNFPLDRIGDTLRLFAEFDRSIQSMQFVRRLNKERPPACDAEQQRWFNRVAELIGGAVVDDGDKILLMQVALLFRKESPLELYEALKVVIDARVAKLTVKSVLPLVCVLEELDRAVHSLEFTVGSARFVVRACVFGAMCEHLLAAELPSDLTSETAIETTLLWLGRRATGRVLWRRADGACGGGRARRRGAIAQRQDGARQVCNDSGARFEAPCASFAVGDARVCSGVGGKAGWRDREQAREGDSGGRQCVGKTQIRRRLGGVHAFEAEHTSTDTADVTSVEVTSLTVSSTTRWIERDDSNTSENVKLHGPAFVRSLMFTASGADNVSHASSILNGAREPEHASSSNSGDARSVAPTKSVSGAATSSDAPTVGVSETIAPAMHAHVPASSARAPTATSSPSLVPQELDFNVMTSARFCRCGTLAVKCCTLRCTICF
jgi:TPR repeat protein